MKKVNMPHQHRPDTHKARPPWRMRLNTPRPCASGKMISRHTMVKKLRQKVTSNFCACSRWRVTTPAMDHSRVTNTIIRTARLCVSFIASGAGFSLQRTRPSRLTGPVFRTGWPSCARALPDGVCAGEWTWA